MKKAILNSLLNNAKNQSNVSYDAGNEFFSNTEVLKSHK